MNNAFPWFTMTIVMVSIASFSRRQSYKQGVADGYKAGFADGVKARTSENPDDELFPDDVEYAEKKQ